MQANIEVPLSLTTNQETTTTKPLEQSKETMPSKLKNKKNGNTAASHPNCPEDLTLTVRHIDGGVIRKKPRRLWSALEEERFFKIWGRDNWLLSWHGKHIVLFGKWSDELRDIYGINTTPQQIQTKVNNMRGRFRQVRRAMIAEGVTTARWEKYTLIDNILKNQYRSEDAEPIPKEALKRNRDMTPPPSHTKPLGLATASPSSVVSSQTEQLILENLGSDIQAMCPGHNDELFPDVFDDIMQEYDFPTEPTTSFPTPSLLIK